MSDNKTLKDSASVDFTVATDEIAGVNYQRVKLTAGADGAATDVSSAAPLPVTGNAGGFTTNPSATITRPNNTTAYDAGDIVANSASAGAVAYPALTVARVTGGSFQIDRLRLSTSSTAAGGGVVRVRLWANAAPQYNAGDNVQYLVSPAATSALYLGSYTGVFEGFNDKCTAILVPDYGAACVQLAAGQQTIFWDLMAVTGFPPVSGATFSLTAEVKQD